MKTKFTFLLVAAVFALGCQRNEMQSIEAQSFSITAQAGDFVASSDPGSASAAFGASKVSKATEMAFQSGDRMGIYVTEGSTPVALTGNHSSNVPYRYDGDWRAAGALAGELVKTLSYRATGYYPYKQGLSDATQIEHEVALDQSSVAGAQAGALELSDFLVSAPSAISGVNATPQDAKASLSFTHAMAKLIVTLTVPEELDGGVVSGLTAVQFKGVRRNCVVNVASGAVSAPATATTGDILPRLASTGGTAKGATVFYEAIVPPQSFAAGASMVWLKFATDKGDKELTYVIPTGGAINLATNQKYTLTLSSIADLAFVTEVPSHLLLDGLAHTEVELKIKSKTAWKLTSPNGGWLKVKTAGGTYGYTVSGSGSAGDQTIYLDLAANASAVLARTAVLALESTVDAKVKTSYAVNQNYFNYTNTQAAWSPAAGSSTQVLAAIDGNQLIRVTSDEGVANGANSWLKIASSATFGAGDPKQELDVVGALAANTLWLQASANNTSAVRSTTVRYTPVDINGTLVTAQAKAQTVTQAVPAAEVTSVALAAGPTALVGHTLFTVKAPAGVEWKLSALSGTDASHFTSLTPAAGVVQTGTGAAVAVKVSAEAVSLGQVKNAQLNVLYALASSPTLQSTDIKISHGMFVSISDDADWLNVSKMGDSKNITVGIVGAAAWTAKVLDGAGKVSTDISVTPATGIDKASVKLAWSPNVTSAAKSSYQIKFFPTGYEDVNATIKTSQLAGPAGVLVDKVVWAVGNLVADGANGCKIGAPADGGLYFQFGSLVGWSGGSSGNGVGVTNTSLSVDKAVWPLAMGTTKPSFAWPSNNGSSAGDKNTVVGQYFFNYNVAPYSTTSQDIRGFKLPFTGDAGSGDLGSGRYAKWGVGDPCSYYLGAPWRLPTGAESAAMCNNKTGINGNYSWADAGGTWVPGSGGNLQGTKLFFPASGYRYTSSGSFGHVTTYGICWSSSVGSATYGLYLYFNSSWVSPQHNNSRSNGFPVRCVRSVP